jgi:hypothetical protein
MGKLLIVTTANDYVHDCIDAASQCVVKLATELGLEAIVCDDITKYFDDASVLKQYNLIVFNNNSGELFNRTQKAVLEEVVKSGSIALLGIHAATAAFLSGEDATGAAVMGTTYPFFADMWGASFTDHPPLQDGTVHLNVEACAELELDLPTVYATNDEW